MKRLSEIFKSHSHCPVIEQRILSHKLSANHMFRQLTGHEQEAVSIIDNRDLSNPNNKLLLICERASNDIKMTKIEHYEQRYLNGHDAFDPGAAELSNYLSERTKCIAFHSNFSRLIIDPSVHTLNNDIVPLQY